MEIVNVLTGEVKFGTREHTLISNAIGSCIVISVYDPDNRIGAMAHIMLPGRAPNKPNINKMKYAENAIDELLAHFLKLGSEPSKLMICSVGGGNVLQRQDDKICRDNIESVNNTLSDHGMVVVADALGGVQRRTSKLFIDTGKFYYTEGNSENKLLFDTKIFKD